MVKLLIIADDLTGALDTAGPFTSQGIGSLVTNLIDPDLSLLPDSAEVLSINTETRHLGAKEAYDRVYSAVESARRQGVRHFYKKTDSALRGNIGAELSALADASGVPAVAFVPAYPQIGRKTVLGVQYIDGVPLHETSYARDPLNPIKTSSVADILSGVTAGRISNLAAGGFPYGDANGILVYDSSSEADLHLTSSVLKERGLLAATAGCAGFAGVLPSVIDFDGGFTLCPPRLEKILFLAGSVNPATLEQANFAIESGISGEVLSFEQRFDKNYHKTPSGRAFSEKTANALSSKKAFLIQSVDDLSLLAQTEIQAAKYGLDLNSMHEQIAENISRLVLPAVPFADVIAVFGGDTLLGLIKELSLTGLRPCREILPGVVLSKAERLLESERDLWIVSKSGGFSGKNIIPEIIRLLNGEEIPAL